MRDFLRKPTFLIALFLSLSVVVNNVQFRPGNNMIGWDVFGYYLYLPQTFIAKDVAMKDDGFIRELRGKYEGIQIGYEVQPLENGNRVLKYSMGMAVVFSPAFFAGHVVAGWTGDVQDGMSAPYQRAMWIWNILITLAGIWILRLVLVRFFSEGISGLVLVLLVFGTNYLMHVTMLGQNGMSHNFLFTAYALLLLLVIRWHEVPKMGRMVPLGLLCGLMILARPSEMVCLMLPLLWGVYDRGSLREKLGLLGRSWGQLVVFAGLILLMGMPQLVYWKYVTGHWLHTAYGGDAGEGFDWLRPHVWQVLVGFRKGWLVYTPLMLLALVGMVPLYRRYPKVWWGIVAYMIFNVYWISAWSCWWYAYSFGQRALIPAMAVMSLPLGAFFMALQGRALKMGLGVGIAVALVALNVFQSLQYADGTLDGTRMTGAYYWRIFGKHVPDAEDRKYMLVNRDMPADRPIEFPELYTPRLFKYYPYADTVLPAGIPPTHGDRVVALHSGNVYSRAQDEPIHAVTDRDHAFLRLSAEVWTTKAEGADEVSMVANFSHADKAYGFHGYPLALRPRQWNHVQVDYLTPEIRDWDDPVRAYLAYNGKDTVYVTGLKMEVLERDE